MQTEKWNRARDLFDKAIDLAEGDREPFLVAACGSDIALLEKLRELIAAYDGGGFLEGAPASADATLDLGATRVVRIQTGDPTQSQSEAPLPHIVGPYRILGVLGQGGMGVVYRARDPKTDELVAVKTVRVPSESMLSGIRREIHALGRLRHPGIVRVLDEGLEGGVPWYAMELVSGCPLQAYRSVATHHLAETIARGTDAEVPAPTLAENASSPDDRVRSPASDLAEILTIARRLCETLAFLHGEGIVHRDLKPDNVLVRPTGQPVLVDFGISTMFTSHEGREDLHALAGAAGTLAYMAPEQIRGELVDARADLYSFGCILYELVAGRPPFVAERADGFIRAHLFEAPAPPSRFAPGIPRELDDLVLRLLAKISTDRIGYATDVAATLARLGARGGGEANLPRPRAYLYRPAFAGRTAALAKLDNILERLGGGNGSVVLVGGESGVGKTRFALEVSRRAERSGALVLTGECVPPGAHAAADGGPLHPMRTPLRRIADRCRERGEAETDALLGARGRLLAGYEPALADLPGQAKFPAPAELPAPAARLRLFEALTATFVEMARSRPLLVVLDDLQWADDLTLGFVGFVACREPSEGAPMLLVATYRSEEQPAALRAILATERIWRVDLGRLEEQAVEEMVGGMLALELAPVLFSRYLSRQSEGNPFFVAEYLRAAVEEHVLARDENGSWHVAGDESGSAAETDYERLGLPRTVRALVARRLGGLGRDAARVVSAAAVIGRNAEADLLGRMIDLDEAPLLEALGEVLRRQILEESADGLLRFTHDKLREAAYEAISPAERARQHGAAARALEEAAPDHRREHAARLADHWRAAGDRDRARPYYLTAAGDAGARYAHAEAERLYRAYVDVTESACAERIEARIGLAGDILRLQGRIDEALEVGRAALDDALALGRRDLEATVLKAMGVLLREGSRLEEAEKTFEACVTAARVCGNRLAEAAATDGMGSIAFQQRRLDDAERLYRRAGELVVEIGDRHREAVSLTNLALLRFYCGHHDESHELIRRALAIHQAIGNRVHEAIDLTNLGHVQKGLGRLEDAVATSELALAIHRETGYRQFEGLTLANLGGFYAELGKLEMAEARCREALAVLEASGDKYFSCGALSDYGMIRRLLGDYEQAEVYARRAVALGDRYRGAADALLYACDLGFVELAQGCSARGRLAEIAARASELGPRPDGELERAMARLRRAVEAFERGEPLLHGEHPADAPSWARAGVSGAREELGNNEVLDG